MNILIDTNILVSAMLFPGSVPDKAYNKAVREPYNAFICDQNIRELKEVFERKFPSRLETLRIFINTVLIGVSLIKIPDKADETEMIVRDDTDRPLMRAALANNIDIILTGDKDFLESGSKHPICLSAADFLDYQPGET